MATIGYHRQALHHVYPWSALIYLAILDGFITLSRSWRLEKYANRHLEIGAMSFDIPLIVDSIPRML